MGGGGGYYGEEEEKEEREKEVVSALKESARNATKERGMTSFHRINPSLMNIIFDYVEVKQLLRFLHAFRSDVRLRLKWVIELLPYTQNGHTLHTFDTRELVSLYKEGIYMQDLHRWVHNVGLVCPKMDTYVTTVLQRTDSDIRNAVEAWSLLMTSSGEPLAVKYGHIRDWDTSRVTDMNKLFFMKNGFFLKNFNEDLSRWDTGNVTNMNGIFMFLESFTSDLSAWNTSRVTDMAGMFNGASAFTSDLSAWNTGNVTNMQHMFACAESFKSDLSGWDVKNLTCTSYMFHGAYSFEFNLHNWNMGRVVPLKGILESDYVQDRRERKIVLALKEAQKNPGLYNICDLVNGNVQRKG